MRIMKFLELTFIAILCTGSTLGWILRVNDDFGVQRQLEGKCGDGNVTKIKDFE